VIIDELAAERARQIGITIGATSHPDIVDVHVALAAAERGHAVLTRPARPRTVLPPRVRGLCHTHTDRQGSWHTHPARTGTDRGS